MASKHGAAAYASTSTTSADAAAAARLDVVAALVPKGIVFRTGRLSQLAEHAIDLVCRHGITVVRSNDGGGLAWQEERRICVPPLTNEENYCVALHEIGHIVQPSADSRQHRHVVKTLNAHRMLMSPLGEVAAWRWAIDHALVWTHDMQQRMLGGLLHYAEDASDAEYRTLRDCVDYGDKRVTENLTR